MKVYIGKHIEYKTIYHVTEKLKYLGFSEKSINIIDTWFEETMPFVNGLFTWFYDKRKRRIKVKIDDYDTWNLDYTLALIILPALKAYKNNHDSSYPGDLKSHEEWEAVLDKMIWSFENIATDYEEDEFYTEVIGKIYFPEPKRDQKPYDKNHWWTHFGFNRSFSHMRFDSEGYTKHREKVQEGLNLFGKYFRNLWD